MRNLDSLTNIADVIRWESPLGEILADLSLVIFSLPQRLGETEDLSAVVLILY